MAWGFAMIALIIVAIIVFILWLVFIYAVSRYTAKKLGTSAVLIFIIWLFFPYIGIFVTLYAIFKGKEGKEDIELGEVNNTPEDN